MISGDRNSIRRFFGASWQKHRDKAVLSPLEHIVVTVVGEHPEYHHLLSDDQTAIAADGGEGEENPFLHMGMHVAMQEQLGAGQPAGIRDLHRRISGRLGDTHLAEHRMMDCLGRVLHDAQASGSEPDSARYLECLKRLAEAGRAGLK